jgi:hypothetical protein
MNRTRTDDAKDTAVAAIEDLPNRLAGVYYGLDHGLVHRQFVLEQPGSDQGLGCDDV